MEQPFKRRRLSQRNFQPTKHATTIDNHGPEWASYTLVKENRAGTHVPLYKDTQYSAPDNQHSPLNKPIPSRKASTWGNTRLPKIRPRTYNAKPSQASAVGSVVQVIVDTKGATLTQALVPAASSVLSFEGIGRLTVDHVPANPSPSQPNTPHQQPTFTIIPQLRKAAATISPSPNQISTAINSQAPKSQKILSAPPSTPLPPSPSNSLDSDDVPLFAASSSAKFHAVNVGSQRVTVEVIIPLASNSTTPIFSDTSTTTLSEATQSKSTQAPMSTTTQSSSITGSSTASTSSTISPSSSSSLSKSASPSTHRTSTSSSLTTPTSSHRSSTTSSVSLTSATGGPIGGAGSGGGATTANGTSPSSTAMTSASSSSSNTSTPAVVGGVVGGVAGLALIILLIIIFLRRRRNRFDQARGLPSSVSQTNPPGSAAQGDTITERSSAVPLTAGGFFRRLRPYSGQTAGTSETGPSERGFQNFGGRKLESVLSSRGDGYGDPGPAFGAGAATGPGTGPSAFRAPALGHSPDPSRQETLSGSSFYRDSQGFYGGKDAEPGSLRSSMHVGPGSAQATSPTLSPHEPTGLPPEGVGGPGQRDSGVAIMRPGPGRTPVTNQPGFTPLRNPPPPPRAIPTADPSQRLQQDQLGRSHPSFDNSRGSRFTEEV